MCQNEWNKTPCCIVKKKKFKRLAIEKKADSSYNSFSDKLVMNDELFSSGLTVPIIVSCAYSVFDNKDGKL